MTSKYHRERYNFKRICKVIRKYLLNYNECKINIFEIKIRVQSFRGLWHLLREEQRIFN